MIYSYFRKMARHLNVNCDFSTGYLVCDIPRDTIEVKIKIKNKWEKHTLTKDKERRIEKYCPWGKCPHKVKISTTRKVMSRLPKKTHDSGSSTDSETWIQVGESFGYMPKYFTDPAPTNSDKENDLPDDSQTVMTLNNLNISDKDRHQEDVVLPEQPQNFVGPYCPTCVLKWHRCICIEESDWDEMVEVNPPMPQTCSPKPENPLENIKQIELYWDEDLDRVDYRVRLANDKRKPKTLMRKKLNFRGTPSCWPRNMKEEKCPTSQHSPEYISMIAFPQPNKLSKVRGLLTMEKRKRPQGWPQCCHKTPQRPIM